MNNVRKSGFNACNVMQEHYHMQFSNKLSLSVHKFNRNKTFFLLTIDFLPKKKRKLGY